MSRVLSVKSKMFMDRPRKRHGSSPESHSTTSSGPRSQPIKVTPIVRSPGGPSQLGTIQRGHWSASADIRPGQLAAARRARCENSDLQDPLNRRDNQVSVTGHNIQTCDVRTKHPGRARLQLAPTSSHAAILPPAHRERIPGEVVVRNPLALDGGSVTVTLPFRAFTRLISHSTANPSASGIEQEATPHFGMPLPETRHNAEHSQPLRRAQRNLSAVRVAPRARDATLLTDEADYAAMVNQVNPYADYRAIERTIPAIEDLRGERLAHFMDADE